MNLTGLVFIGAALSAIVIAVWLLVRFTRRRLVFVVLDSAYQNGYFQPGEHLYGCSPDEIAYDITTYAIEFEDTPPENIAPYVRQWLRHKGMSI